MMSIQLDEISSLIKSSNGIWQSRSQQGVSFPCDGNETRQRVESQSFWYSHRNQCILNSMQNFSPNGPVLDVGGGNGTVSLAIQKAGYDAILLEPEMAGVQKALRDGLSTVICSTFDAANFRSNSIPAVGLFDVLEHIEDDVFFLFKIHNVLEPGGKIYLTVPAFKFLWSAADDIAGHFRRYTKSDLVDVFNKAGFKVSYISYFFSLLIPPIYLFRSVPYILCAKHVDLNWRHKHHQDKSGIAGSLLLKGMRWEQNMISNNSNIPLGSSCILVAEKI